MHLYQFTDEQLEEQSNTIRRILIDKLFQDGVISRETYDDYMLNIAIVIRKPSLFNEFWKSVLRQKDQTSYIIVRQESLERDMENSPDGGEKANRPKLEVIDLDKHKKK